LQLPLPSHRPLAWVAEGQDPGQAPLSVSFSRRFQQVPSWVATLHDWHGVLHAELQQYPSTQLPLTHCAALVQVWPLAICARHLLPSQ
jgi:hypothetical protein